MTTKTVHLDSLGSLLREVTAFTATASGREVQWGYCPTFGLPSDETKAINRGTADMHMVGGGVVKVKLAYDRDAQDLAMEIAGS